MARANKLTMGQVKMLCDFFAVDRDPDEGEKVTKELLIDRLLDFLSGPNDDMTIELDEKKPLAPSSRGTIKGTKSPSPQKKKQQPEKKKSVKKKSGKSKKSKKSPASGKTKSGRSTKKVSYAEESDESEEFQEDDDEESESEPETGEMPDDEELRMWVKAYVACHNMNKVTIKHALKLARDKFGVKMDSKKQTMKEFLTEEC